ncbi:MAG TPA: metal-dependent hydrolase [Acidiferrobacterales bacterium]
MDTLTHALSGALVARLLPATADRPALSRRAALAAGAGAAVFPDIDFALRLIDTLIYLNHHQGLTHSLLLWPVWTVLLAWGFSRLSRGRYRWRAFLPPVAGGLAAHLLGDLVTAYGIQLFAPLSAQRYAADLVFLFDAAITVILIAGLAAAWRWPARRAIAMGTLVALLLYLGAAAGLQQRALGLAGDYAEAKLANVERVSALPQPPSVFHWLLIAGDTGHYHVARVNLARQTGTTLEPETTIAGRYLAAFHPPGQLDWQREAAAAGEAWESPALAPVRRFMRYPVVDREAPGPGEHCRRFVDLRFTLPALTASFRYGACRAGDGEPWRLTRWRGAFYID